MKYALSSLCLYFSFFSLLAQQEQARVELKYQCDIESLKIKTRLSFENESWELKWESADSVQHGADCDLWLTRFENGKPTEPLNSDWREEKTYRFKSDLDSINLRFYFGNKYQNSECNCFFKELKIPLREIKNNQINLLQDKDWYFYKYLSFDEFEESLVNRDKFQAQVVKLNASYYYLDLKSGKIKSGRKLTKSKNIFKITQKMDLVPVFEYRSYKNNKKESYSGTELINQRKLDMSLFKGTEKQFFNQLY